MSSPAKTSTPGRRRGLPTAAGVTASSTALLAVLAVWYTPTFDGAPIQSFVCEKLPAEWTVVPTQVCEAEFRSVSLQDAEQAIDNYLNQASGADPQNAFDMFTEDVGVDNEEFLDRWEDTLFADRTGDVEELGDNKFRFTYTRYGGAKDHDVGPARGWVSNDDPTEMGLQRTDDDGFIIDHLSPPDRGPGDFVEYVRSQPISITETYKHAARVNVVAPKVGRIHLLSLLCQVEIPGDGWWSRTGWGWIAHEDLQIGEGAVTGEPRCDEHSVDRADAVSTE